ncbi:MAG: MBL fold metallo-hydrolase [Pseudomonadota bacterium]
MLCKIGDVEIWRLLEINGPFLTLGELFPGNGSEAQEAFEKYAPHQLCQNTGKLILPVQAYLLKTPAHTILIDSGVGNDKDNGLADWNKRSSDRFMAALTAADVSPDDIDYVLFTHLHSDHVGWNTKLEEGQWVPTFPNARYLINAAENEYFREQAGTTYMQSVMPVVEAGKVDLITPDHKLGDSISLISTPGHTPGHVSILINSNGSEAIITGDAIHTSVQCRYPDWHFKFDTDASMAVTSRWKLLEEASSRNMRVISFHFALPSIGRVKKHGEAFLWEEE